MRTLLCLVSVTTCILVILCLTNAHPMDDVSTDAAAAFSAASSTEGSSPSSSVPSSTDANSSMGSTTEGSANASAAIDPKPAVGYLNGSKLVITNVVKTIEFDVALEEDDNSTESSSAESSTKYLETDIKVLNPALLEEVVYELSSTHENLAKSIDGTKSLSNEQDDDDDD